MSDVLPKKKPLEEGVSNMSKTKEILDFILKIREIIIAASAIALWVLALWLSYKLAPITESINLIEHRVSANEDTITDIRQDVTTINGNVITVKEDVSFIKGVLSND